MSGFVLSGDRLSADTDEPRRGALRRAITPPDAWIRQQRKRLPWNAIGLYRVEDALEFSADPALENSVELIREFRRHPFARALDELVYEDQLAEDAIRGVRRVKRGRPRMRGSWPSLYLAYVLSRYAAIQPYLNEYRNSAIWEVCGFDHVPSYAQIHAQFMRLEEHVADFKIVADSIALACKEADARFGRVIFCDSTLWRSSARLQHHCLDARSCGKYADASSVLPLSSEERIDDARRREHEIEDFTVTPAEPELTRVGIKVVANTRGRETRIGMYRVGGHDYWAQRDYTSGLRKYGTGALTYGGYFQGGIDAMTGMTVACEVFAADVQEYDGLPGLFEGVATALGERPYIVSVDRGFMFKAACEFATRRGVALVGPLRRVAGKRTATDWRTRLYDEHGVPRCQGCGRPGNIHIPGLGLTFSERGEPVLRFRCELPLRSGKCRKIQTVACSDEWRLLTPLSRLTELHQAVRAMHSSREHVFKHVRQRYSAIAKDLSAQIARPGVPAQRLRAQAAVLLDLFRGALRLGWLEPYAIPVNAIDVRSATVCLSGKQDLVTGRRIKPGHGSARLDDIRKRRAALDTDVPNYGKSREAMAT